MWLKKTFKFVPPILLVVIAFVTHRVWFNFNSTLTFSDWYWWPDMAVKELLTSWGTWVHGYWGLGTPNVQIYFNIMFSVWSILVKAGLTFDQVVKINLFIPVAIMGFISPYILGLKITHNRLASFAVALFYGSNTYFLSIQTAHLPIAFVNAFAPLILFLFIETFQHNSFKSWLIFIISFFLVSNYEIRISYILGIILFIYYCVTYLRDSGKYIKYILGSLLIYTLLNSYWLLPTVLGSISSNVIGAASRGLFGDSLSNIQNAFTLSIWSWTGSYPNQNFEVQKIIEYFWSLPFLVFSTFLNRRINSKRFTIFFLLITLLGIFLTKQSSMPFSGIYQWLYYHFPGFVLFRESSKFYIFTALGYAGLILLNINSLKYDKPGIYKLLIGVVILMSFINLKPLYTGEIETTFINRQQLIDYNLLNTKLNTDKNYYRIMSVPQYSKWINFSENHPRVFFANELENNWRQIGNFDKLPSSYDYLKKTQNFFSKISTKRLIDQCSIKYIIVPISDDLNNDNFFKYYAGSPENYNQVVDKITGLVKSSQFGENVYVYENPNFRPHFYLTLNQETLDLDQKFEELSANEINPSHYEIILPPGSINKYLSFTDLYDKNWMIKIGKINWLSAILNKNYFISSKYHFKSEAMLNSFILDPNVYKINNDEQQLLSIYYFPQSYFYLGLIISLGTFGIAFISLLIVWKKRKYEKDNS